MNMLINGLSIGSTILNISLYVRQKLQHNMVDTNWTLDANRAEPMTFLQNRPSHQSSLAPLICRVVRAVRVRGRWAWIPGGGPPLRSGFHPQPPIIFRRPRSVGKASGIRWCQHPPLVQKERSTREAAKK